ncbi:hypothetical protein K438DRAFT_296570 [Mycena galopus ATCC 62051]|nr:hypothetical protein K438DRAFT_296570 [Mycena galopus ATCC 62051]
MDFRAQCGEIVGPLPFYFSSRVTVSSFDNQVLTLLLNSSSFQRGISLSIRSLDPANFPIGGFEFACEDYRLKTKLQTALGDKGSTVRQTLDDLSTFLEPSAIPLPDGKTHIVCVLGPSNLDDDEHKSVGEDFASLYRAFGGVAASETWLSSQNLHPSAENQGDRQILHGCTPQPRRIIFNEDTPTFYNVVADPFEAFDKSLRNVVRKAKRDERIIVIICAHGSRYGDSFHLGRRMFSKARMQGILCQSKAPITIISTSYHSGLWAVPNRALSNLFPASDDIQPGTLPELYQEGTMEKVIDIYPFLSTRATSPKFNDFAHKVASNIHIPQCDKDLPLATILGLRDKVSLLYRLYALRELPPQANYSLVPLGVEQVEARTPTGGLRTTVLARVQHYWDTYHPSLIDQPLAPYNTRLVVGAINLHHDRLDGDGIARLLLHLNVRIELDDAANRLAAHIVCFGDDKARAGPPSILHWDPATFRFATMRTLSCYFCDLQTRLCPGWRGVLHSPYSGYVDDRPAAFLACVAYDQGYTTVERVQPVVDVFFQARRPPSLSASASLGPDSV